MYEWYYNGMVENEKADRTMCHSGKVACWCSFNISLLQHLQIIQNVTLSRFFRETERWFKYDSAIAANWRKQLLVFVGTLKRMLCANFVPHPSQYM